MPKPPATTSSVRPDRSLRSPSSLPARLQLDGHVLGLDDAHSYSPAEHEGFRNAVLSLYNYIFSALLSAEMTSRQNTLFHFTIELLLTIPSATLDTLITGQ
ncbi:hypothetical protein I6F33_34485 [Bradyrhizobium sp. BRP20]|uniref:hypothetical protein n=1 Tax=unclassified Bradyrhizobium TaxID=2631580 RepID=UPI001CD364C0|nr:MULTISPECIES: hypothetical protein [unclassified Bradyrhizobium]MCA1438025.1 hypothetical protein [Bradyrhizobium sp. BRP20]MCA1552099.1 hypothetical protein [Bradyrhizobium sp. BRP19]